MVVEHVSVEVERGPSSSAIEGLQELLSVLKLDDYLDRASAWCTKKGADSVDDLNAENYPEQLAEELQLPEIKAKKLIKALRPSIEVAAQKPPCCSCL